jgi:hypothetical protein
LFALSGLSLAMIALAPLCAGYARRRRHAKAASRAHPAEH